MPEYVIDTTSKVEIDWGAKGVKRIIQNVQNLISTFRYECAYDRVKGIDPNIIDMPADEALNLYTAEVIRVVGDYEPRAKIKDVQLVQIDSFGNLQIRVVIEI